MKQSKNFLTERTTQLKNECFSETKLTLSKSNDYIEWLYKVKRAEKTDSKDVIVCENISFIRINYIYTVILSKNLDLYI